MNEEQVKAFWVLHRMASDPLSDLYYVIHSLEQLMDEARRTLYKVQNDSKNI